MNRNQKIAIGCGAAGCLGLIVVVIAGCLICFLMPTTRSSNRNRNSNSNGIFSNSNSNSHSDSNSSDSNSNSNENGNSSSMSDDDKHKLFWAGAASQDVDLVQRVNKKLGLTDATGAPNEHYVGFVKDHVSWVLKNGEFAKSLDTPEKARAYVEAHIDD